jgi:hypothetical protein
MVKYIRLSQEQTAIVDDDKYDYLNQWKWFARKSHRTYYAERKIRLITGKQKTIHMHHDVFSSTTQLDHIDGNGLNNQLLNLRAANSLQNSRNKKKRNNCSSIFYGVSLYKPTGKWHAQIRAGNLQENGNHKRIHLGYFDLEIEAAIAYDMAAKKHFGEFAKLNFSL